MAEHWCKEHGVAFFKKGNMKGWAHPIVDENGESTGKWCNEPKEQTQTGGLKADISQRFNRGKSEEELELSRRSFALSYAKDLVVAHEENKENILARAKEFYDWLKNEPTEPKESSKPASPATAEQKKQLAEFEKKRPGRIAEIMKEQGFTRELTKTQASIVQAIFITEEETGAKKASS